MGFVRHTRNQSSISGDSEHGLDQISSGTESQETNYALNNRFVKINKKKSIPTKKEPKNLQFWSNILKVRGLGQSSFERHELLFQKLIQNGLKISH